MLQYMSLQSKDDLLVFPDNKVFIEERSVKVLDMGQVEQTETESGTKSDTYTECIKPCPIQQNSQKQTDTNDLEWELPDHTFQIFDHVTLPQYHTCFKVIYKYNSYHITWCRSEVCETHF